MVHGVGGHDHLSNLLRTYQSFRANLTSVEAPVVGEDQIPGWRLVDFNEGADPPVLRLEPILPTPEGGVGAVVMYEVNYSGFAGVVRRNHPIDLTGLFLGLDLAICAARQRKRDERDAAGSEHTPDIAAHRRPVAAAGIAVEDRGVNAVPMMARRPAKLSELIAPAATRQHHGRL